MACYCGVCGCQIYSAVENEGSFPVGSAFEGVRTGKIEDTCEDCGRSLRQTITNAATVIARKHRARIDALRAERHAAIAKMEADKAKEREFRAAWERQKRAEKGDE